MKYLAAIVTLLFFLSCDSKMPSEYILEEKDLVPEGIAYSEKNDAFYLTSVGKSKIVELDRKSGTQIDFIGSGEFDYTPGAGIFVDNERNLLYAIGGYYITDVPRTYLYRFDLNTKQLLNKYDVPDAGDHFLNDLVMDKKGSIYLTNSKDSSVYLLPPGGAKLELFYKSEEIDFPNGIAISDDNSKLYIASIPKGVRILDINTKILLNGPDTLGVSQGIDGLEFYQNHLYGIQNSVWANTFNFRKLLLNEAQDSIVGLEIIDSKTPKLDVPLTFCIVDNEAVLIGNSNLQHLNQKTFEFANSDTIAKTKLLVYKID